MIYLYSGTPGSGKSYNATRQILYALDRRKPVPLICNYDIRHDTRNYDDAFHFVPNTQLHPKDLVAFAREWWETHRFHENGIMRSDCAIRITL